MQELGKFSFKIDFISNGLEKCMSFTINDKLTFIDSFQFLSSCLDTFVKNLSRNGFKYLSQEFNYKVLDLFKQKDFNFMSISVVLKGLKNNHQAKVSFIVC